MKIIAHDGLNTIAKDLQHGDRLPVGGSMFSDKATTHLECDFDQCQALFTTYDAINNKIDMNAIGTWLEANSFVVDKTVYQHCAAFTMALKNQYPDFSSNFARRATDYTDNAKLSDLLDNGLAACSEISALAVKALESSGLDAEIVIGEYFRNEDEEFSDAHSFVMIKAQDNHYIFDAARMLKHENGSWLANIFEISVQQHNVIEEA